MRRLALAGISATLLCAPFGCGGDAFTAGSGDAGAGGDVTAGDDAGMVSDATPDVTSDARPRDGSADVSAPPPLEAGGGVMGHVVDVFGRPVTGASVRSGMGNATTTDAQGAFVLQGISPPYDVFVGHKAADGSPRAYDFVGLTRADPTLQLALEDVASPLSATVAGTLPVIEVANPESLVFVDLPSGAWPLAKNAGAYSSSVSTFSLTAGWEGPPSVNAAAYLLQWGNDSSGLPSSYQAAAETMAALASGQTTTAAFGTPPAIQTSDISTAVGVAAGYTLADAALYVRPSGATVAAPIVHTSALPPALAVPNWAGATYVLCATQQPTGQDASASPPYGRACRAGIASGANATVTPPTATTLINTPSRIGVGDQLAWNPMPVAGVYGVVLEAAAPNPSILIVTSKTTMKVPDFGAVGAALPSGQTYVLVVLGLAPFASIDDAAGPSGYDAMVTAGQYDHGPAADGQMAWSGAVPVVTH